MVTSAVSEKSPATSADLEALPEGVKGEIIDGVLYTQPRPRFAHQAALGALLGELHGPFQRGRSGPGGWWILPEPGITAEGSPEFSPDLAGWRRERLPEPPSGRIDVVPDWLCEILSPSTRRYDLGVKRRFYARIGVRYLWYVDLEARTITVSRLSDDGHWLELDVLTEGSAVHAEPFGALALDLSAFWEALGDAHEG